MIRSSFSVALLVLVASAASPAWVWAEPVQTLVSSGVVRGLPAGGPYVPPGNLYDNEQSQGGGFSLASQDSSGNFTARAADDFVIPAGTCVSGQFAITQIRLQVTQQDTGTQALAVDLYADGGGTPSPANAISPIFSTAATNQALLGVFLPEISLYEATFEPAGLILDADTTYWISGYGTGAATNNSSVNVRFARSPGAATTTANGVFIAPGFGPAVWTPVETELGGDPWAFSFALDGVCLGGGTAGFDVEVPTLGHLGIASLVTALVLAAVFLLRRLT